jgi:hypothetical protein
MKSTVRAATKFSTLVLLAALLGCHTMQFEVVDSDHTKRVYHRNHFFLWGLAPTVEVDVSHYCPAGIAAIREETTVVDYLFLTVPTLGIYQPRSAWYYCLPEPAEVSKP